MEIDKVGKTEGDYVIGAPTMLSEIGIELRKLRVERGERLLDMGQKLAKSASFISAIEVGTKSPPQGFEDDVIAAYHLDAATSRRLRSAANASRTSFEVRPATAVGRDTAALFARRINHLSDDQLEKIVAILGGKKRGS